MSSRIAGIVYLVTNTINNKRYVGITTRTLKVRWKGHLKSAVSNEGGRDSLQEAIRVFGKDAFNIQKLASAESLNELAETEILYINELNTLAPNGYNQNRGGVIRQGTDVYIVEGEEYFGLASLADAYGIPEITMHKRMQSGRWTIEQACGIEKPPEYSKKGILVTVYGINFESITKAAEYFGVDKRVVDYRINRFGWTLEEALEIKERPRNCIEVAGTTFSSFKEACDYYNINPSKAESRRRLGWTLEETFDVVPRSSKQYVVDGQVFSTLKELAQKYNKSPRLLSSRLYSGWTPEQAVGIAERPNSTTSHGPIPTSVNGIVYKSRAAACRANNISESFIKSQLKKGLSIEEAFNLADADNAAPKKSYKVNERVFLTISSLAKAYGVEYSTLTYRLRSGWDVEEAVGLAPKPMNNPLSKKYVVNNKEYSSIGELCREYGIVATTFSYRIKNGWSISQALGLEEPPSMAKCTYIVTSPAGEEIKVTDFPKFAATMGFPEGGEKLRRVATTPKLHSWRGWKCKKVK